MEQIEIIERIKTILENTGNTTNSFAVKSNIDPSNMAKMLEGKQKISVKTIRKISETFSVNYFWLLTGDGDMFLSTGNQIATNNKNVGDNSGNVTINGCAGKEQDDKRNDAMQRHILQMITQAYSKTEEQQRISNARFENLEKLLAERNRISDRLIDMLESKDEQIKELILLFKK